MSAFMQIMGTIGQAAAKTGTFVGRKVAEGYHSIDPDVMRHVAQVPLLGYSLLVSRRDPIEAGEPDGYPPLIFVHGLGGNRGNFLLMAGYFWMMGRKRSYKIHFDGGQSLEDMAHALARFIEDVRKATGEDQVDIVAHSMGGIVTRLALAENDTLKHVRTLITLGTPHYGTYPARYANTELTRALRPDSDLMQRLERADRLAKNMRVVTFWSRNDLFVLPPTSAALEGAEQIDATPFTHYSYLIDPKSWKAVGKILLEN